LSSDDDHGWGFIHGDILNRDTLSVDPAVICCYSYIADALEVGSDEDFDDQSVHSNSP
jgi:hypothetical protein